MILTLDILAEDDDGTILLDLTSVFSTDMGGLLSAKNYLSKGGLAVVAPIPTGPKFDAQQPLTPTSPSAHI